MDSVSAAGSVVTIVALVALGIVLRARSAARAGGTVEPHVITLTRVFFFVAILIALSAVALALLSLFA